MKIAFVSQPWEAINQTTVGGSSVATITYRLAQRLSTENEVVIYSKKRPVHPVSSRDERGILFQRFSNDREAAVLKPFILADRFAAFFTTRRPFVASSYYFRRYALQVAEDLKAQRCDVVHIQNFSQFAPVIKAANPSAKIVLHMHCEWLTQLDRTTIARRLQDVDMVVGCSEFITESARRRFPEFRGRWATVFNGVALPEGINDRGAKTTETEVKRLLYVGRLSPEKGVHVLLEAFNRIVEEYPEVYLDTIGPPGLLAYNFLVGLSDDKITQSLCTFYGDSLFQKMKKQLIEKGAGYQAYLEGRLSKEAAGKVSFHGYIPHGERLDGFYRDADIFVLPSVCNEAFGMTPAEAMAFGVPSVVSRSGGVVEVVEDGVSGLVVERNSADAMAEGVLRLLEDDRMRRAMSQAGRIRASTLFTWERVASELQSEYHQLLSTSREVTC